MFEKNFLLTGVLLLTRPPEKSLMASLHKDSLRTHRFSRQRDLNRQTKNLLLILRDASKQLMLGFIKHTSQAKYNIKIS